MKSVFNRLSILLTTGALIVAQVIMPVHAAFATSESGNNGTLKVHERGTASDTESNDPKVCIFNFEGFMFDKDQSGIIVVAPQGGDSDTTDTVSLPFGPANADGYAQTSYINDGISGLQLDNGHYKTTLLGKDSQGSYTVDLKAKSKVFKVECQLPTPISVTAVDGTFADVCGTTFNAFFIAPTTAGVTYHPVVTGNTITVTATANAGYTLSNPNWVQTYTDQLIACVVPPSEIATPSVTVNPICGIGTDTLSYAAETDDYTSSVAWNQLHTQATITFTIKNGVNKVFTETYTKTVTVVVNENNTAECPREAQPCTVHNNLFTKEWTYDGTTMPESGADSESGSALPGTYEFVNNAFFTGIHLTTPAVESYVDGLIDAGDTNIQDVDAMSYTTYRSTSSTGYAGTLPAYILQIDKDGNPATSDDLAYLFYEPYNNGPVVAGIWQSWDALDSGNAKWWMSGTGQTLQTWDYFTTAFPHATVLGYGFNQGTYNAGADTYIKSMTFDCATTTFSAPGKGGLPEVVPTPTPVAVPTPTVPAGKGAVMPTELPETGTGSNALLIGLAAAAVAYGAVYFAQPKRRYE